MKHRRLIAAMDNKRGIANVNGIPWNLPLDKRYFREKTEGGNILMGYNTYEEFDGPLPNRQNFVVCDKGTQLRPGFHTVYDMHDFLNGFDQDVWIIGGAAVFEQAIVYADELYLTQIDKNFRCSKRFPEYRLDFKRRSRSPDHTQNTLSFRFEVWERLKHV